MLKDINIFTTLAADDLAILEQHMVTRSFQKNTLIISEGDDASSLFIILSGAVKVFLSNDDGKEIIVNTQEAGEYFGELALLDDAPRSASVMTTEKSSIGILSKSEFTNLLTGHPELALRLIRELTHRIRLLSDNVRTLALMDVYGRVAKILLALAEEVDEKLVITERPTQQDIANRIGASREMVARILKDLSTGKYITITDKQIIINERLPDAY